MFDNAIGAKARRSKGRRNMTVFLVFALLLVLLPASQVAAQEPAITQVILQQGLDGYEGTTDTYLDLGNATTAWGAADRLRAKTTENADILVRFDVDSLPTGSTVQQATLRLYVFDYGLRPVAPQGRWWGPTVTLRSHQMLHPWSEDTATWFQAADGDPWSQPGCQGAGADYAEEYSDELVGFSKYRDWAEFDVTEMVQQWIDNPDSNYGVIVKAYLHTITISGSAWSSEGPMSWFRPQLVIDYQ